MKRLVAFFWIFLCLSVGSKGETISLEQLLDLVRETHPLILEENLTPQIETERRFRYTTGEDWVLGGNASYFHSKPVGTSPFSPSTLDIIGVSASLSRSLWSTGGRLKLDWSTDYTEQTLPDLSFPGAGGSESFATGFPRLYEHALSFSYSQPLLRNYGGDLSRLDYDLAEYTVNISELDAIERQEQFLLDIALTFIDWALLREQKRITEQRLQLAREQLDLTTEKRKANLVDEVDVLRSEDAVRAARQNAVLLDSRSRAKQAELAVLAQADSLRLLLPAYDLYTMVTYPRPDEAVTILEENSRALRALQVREEQLRKLQRGFEEGEKPSLDLDIGVVMKGGDDSFGSSLEITKPDFALSLFLTQPLGARAERSNVIQTELEIRQNEMRYRRVLLDLRSRLDALLIQLTDLEQILMLNRDEIESAQEKASEELRLYNQGRGDLTFVIQARDNEQNARLLYAENAAGYHRLYHQYLALSDLLLHDDL
jgi:outer membrane protein TolC